MKTFFTINLGCKVNLFETNAITYQLVQSGFKHVQDINKANIVLINTCSVTNKADSKSRNMISRAKQAKKKPIVVVMGCFAQVNKEWFKDNPVDIVIGTNNKTNIVKLINEYLESKKSINKLIKTQDIKQFEDFGYIKHLDNTRAFLKIQDGCNFYCSYCLIPYCRGNQRAMKHIDVINAVKDYVSKGYKEIVLTGVNTAGYKDGNYNFFNLLTDLDKLEGDFRIRISSLEPFQIDHKLIDLLASNPNRWANQIHLCLQSASSKVLKEMNRRYTIEEFIDLVKYIRSKMKDVAITTDYIVAFASETDKDFNDSIKNLKKLQFANMNVFIYSRRKGTVADIKYKNDINPLIARNRYNQVVAIKDKYQKQYLESLINKPLDVIVEKSIVPTMHGYSSEFVKVVFKSKTNFQHKQVTIIPKQIKKDKFGYYLIGIKK